MTEIRLAHGVHFVWQNPEHPVAKTSERLSVERFEPSAVPLMDSRKSTAVSNAHGCAVHGLNRVGTAASDMGLNGTFADMILACLPLGVAWPLAQRFADNPAVQRWASLHTIGELVESIRSTAHGALQAMWPIGVGVSMKGHAAGQLVGGLDGIVAGSMVRTSVDALALRIEGKGAIDLEGGAIGLEVHDRFGSVHGASVGAGLCAGVGYRADAVGAFDPVEVLRLAGHLAKDLNGLLGLAGDAHQMLQRTGVPVPELPDFLGPEWAVEHELFLRGRTGVRWAPLAEDAATRLCSAHGFADDLLTRLEAILPFLNVQGEGGVAVTVSNGGTTRMEAAVSAESLAAVIRALPEVGNRMAPAIAAGLVEHIGSGAAVTLEVLWRNSGSSNAPLIDGKQSGLRWVATEVADGIEVSHEEFCSLDSMDSSVARENDGGEAEWFADHTKTIRVALDPERIPEQCPDVLQRLIDLTGSVIPTTASVHLIGTAALAATDLRRAWLESGAHGALRSGDVARQAIDCAAGRGGESLRNPVVIAAAQSVRFSEARLIGGIRAGQGGGVDAALMGVSGKAVVRSEQGLTMDVRASNEDAERVRLALRGGDRAV